MFRLPGWQIVRGALALSLIIGLEALGSARTVAELNPKAISIQLPAEIKWNKGRSTESVTLVGDPSKPGFYVVLQKWLAHNNSRPHFHPNDRYITVISGTWWVNTGAKYDLEGMKPVPAAS